MQAFVLWFLRVCLDQVIFMSGLFDLDGLSKRLRRYVERSDRLKPQAARLLEEALIRGEFERGDIDRITGLPERTARRVLSDLIDRGLLGSDTPKGRVSLRFPAVRGRFARRCGIDCAALDGDRGHFERDDGGTAAGDAAPVGGAARRPRPQWDLPARHRRRAAISRDARPIARPSWNRSRSQSGTWRTERDEVTS